MSVSDERRITSTEASDPLDAMLAAARWPVRDASSRLAESYLGEQAPARCDEC